jgi:geranylgeranyl pyrophosphate synthase
MGKSEKRDRTAQLLAAVPPISSPDEVVCMITEYDPLEEHFRLASAAGAIAAGAPDASAWAEIGQLLGLAYQLADDLCDACGSSSAAGKPVRRDAILGRPNAAVRTGETYTRTGIDIFIEQTLTRTKVLTADPKPLVRLIEEMAASFQCMTH